jgi:hypothetical protein
MLMLNGGTDIPRALTQGHRAWLAGRCPDRCRAGGTRRHGTPRLRQHPCQPLQRPADRMPPRLPAPPLPAIPASGASIAAANLTGTLP